VRRERGARAAARAMAPVVEYASRQAFLDMAERALQEYGETVMLFAQAAVHQTPAAGAGVAVRELDCAPLRARGLAMLLRLTFGRGRWWAAIANEHALAAAAAFFRRSCVMNLAWLMAVPVAGRELQMHRRQFYHSLGAGMGCASVRELGPRITGALHARCFAHFREPARGCLRAYLPRRAALEHLVAAASMQHPRLGAASPGRVLDLDAWQVIAGFLDFA